ncbi:MAG: hypothetical protein ACWGQW_02850 [bacterium]
MNIFQTIRSIFVEPKVEERPKWDIHWYGHILNHSESLGGDLVYINADHLGIVQYWDNDRIVPRLGDVLTYIPANDKISENGRRFVDMPAIINGVVIEVHHSAYGDGGTITVFANNNIFNRSDLNVYEVVTDEVYQEVKAARQSILSGDPIPLTGFITIS